jgi:hypothetical protein
MPTQFYIGQVVDPEDLLFRDEFIEELWDNLDRQHVVLTAPRRTGKTSVMTHLLERPRTGWLVLSLNVQDTSHPVDFYLQLLDEFNTRDPATLRKLYHQSGSFIGKAIARLESLEYGSLKVALRESDSELSAKWKDRLDDLLERIRKTDRRVLIILDELPDMLLAMQKNDAELLREFLGWFRRQRLTPKPSEDRIRWLIGGSVNLTATLDAIGLLDRMNDPVILPLPVFTDKQVAEFVRSMLDGLGCTFSNAVPKEVVKQLGRPIPLFLQMATQELYRIGRLERRKLTVADVSKVFGILVVSIEARDKLQHYYSRIARYYSALANSAHALLNMLCLSPEAVSRRALQVKFEQIRHDAGIVQPAHDRDRAFNELMLHLENDFYIEEVETGRYDFASGLLKSWWRKYYA